MASSDASAAPAAGARLQALARVVWSPPPAFLREERWRGELLLSWIRLAVVGAWFALVAVNWLRGAPASEALTGIAISTLAMPLSLALDQAIRRHWWEGTISFVASVFDITMISIAVAYVYHQGLAHPDAFAMSLFPYYLAAIMVTALRHDRRVTLVATATVAVQHGAVSGWLGSAQMGGEYGHQHVYAGAFWLGNATSIAVAALVAWLIIWRSQKLHHLSISDPLTGLYHRGYLEHRLEQEAERVARTGRGLVLAMLDVDYFKPFNDRWGHAAGDRALQRVARVLRRSVRATDLVARYGGEEFAVVLGDADSAGGRDRIEAIREAVERLGIPVDESGELVGLTVSAGVARLPEDDSSPWAALRLADRRLYEAKRTGRNCVVGWAEAPEPVPCPAAASTEPAPAQ